jgi:hypothetical protein
MKKSTGVVACATLRRCGESERRTGCDNEEQSKAPVHVRPPKEYPRADVRQGKACEAPKELQLPRLQMQEL